MTELTIYRCDICGLDFDDKELCYRHEDFHEIRDFIEKENVKFCHNGHRISIYKYKDINDLLGDIDAIEVSNPHIARKINKFYYEKNLINRLRMRTASAFTLMKTMPNGLMPI